MEGDNGSSQKSKIIAAVKLAPQLVAAKKNGTSLSGDAVWSSNFSVKEESGKRLGEDGGAGSPVTKVSPRRCMEARMMGDGTCYR